MWNIVSGVPGNNYSLTLKLRDLNSIYPDSAPFTLIFTPIVPPQLAIADNRDGTIKVTFTASPEEEYVVQIASALEPGLFGPTSQRTEQARMGPGLTPNQRQTRLNGSIGP